MTQVQSRQASYLEDKASRAKHVAKAWDVVAAVAETTAAVAASVVSEDTVKAWPNAHIGFHRAKTTSMQEWQRWHSLDFRVV